MKNTPTTSRPRSVLVAALLTGIFFLGHVQSEDTIVRWKGNYLAEGYTGNLYLNRGTETALPDGKAYPDLATEKSPVNPRYDRTAPSAVFFGALHTVSSQPVPTDKSRMQVRYESGENRLSFGSMPGERGNTVWVRGLIFWRDAEFLGPWADAPLPDLSAIGKMILNVTGMRGKAEVRFAVQSEGKWYFSEETLTGQSPGPEPISPGTLVLTDPGQSRWGLWQTPGGDLPLAEIPSTYDVAPSSLKTISAVGFYFSAEYSASNAALFELNEFLVTGKRRE